VSHEIDILKQDLLLSAYPRKLIDSVVNRSEGNDHSRKEVKPIGSAFIPYMKGISEKFRCISYGSIIRTIFETRHTLRSILMSTRPGRALHNIAHCVYNIHCECGRNYIGETDRPMGVRFREHSTTWRRAAWKNQDLPNTRKKKITV
jgi:hypothetical protein